MGELNSISQLGIGSAAPIPESKRSGLSFKAYQELKSGVHRDLISRVDQISVPGMP